MKMLNELVLILLLTLGLGGAHVDDGKGSFNCDVRMVVVIMRIGGMMMVVKILIKNTGKREQAITLVQLRSSRPSSTP